MSDKPANESELLELYKLYAEHADRINQRREAANRMFIGLVVAMLTAFFLMLRFGGGDSEGGNSGSDENSGNAEESESDENPESARVVAYLLLFCGGGVGTVLCIAWLTTINYYLRWSISVSNTLEALETQISFFSNNKKGALGRGFLPNYKVARSERMVPGAFMFIFVMMSIMGLLSGIITLPDKIFWGAVIFVLYALVITVFTLSVSRMQLRKDDNP